MLFQKIFEEWTAAFKRVFADKGRKYVYRFDLHDIYRSGDLAVANQLVSLRLQRWSADLLHRGSRLDVFQRNAQGQWQIVYYLAYEEPERLSVPARRDPDPPEATIRFRRMK